MQKKTWDKLRAAILAVSVAGTVGLCGVQLITLQVVEGETYLARSKASTHGLQTIQAARGEIMDLNGKPIVRNKVGFNVIVEKAFFPTDLQEGNAVILKLARQLQKDGLSWVDSLPISTSAPFSFLDKRDNEIQKMKGKNYLDLQVYATASNCMDELVRRYEISPSYTAEEQRLIAGVRYEMLLKGFSVSNRYIFAEDIPTDTVAKLRELSYFFPGVSIAEEAIRVYEQGDILSQSIGTVGPIYAEEYNDAMKDLGYKKSDTIGKSGVEKALESELRGHNGQQLITISEDGVTVDEVEKSIPGHSVKLTIDSDFQRELDKILAEHIAWLNATQTPLKGGNATAGALAVIDVKTGAVLGLSNFPTYDINDYLTHYSEVASRENSPLINRAIDGQYRPGSTFKTVTATAALNEGIITETDEAVCAGRYTFYDDYQPKCTGVHGRISVTRALEKSCNIFFYDVGRRTGIQMLDQYAAAYGLGEDLGLEIGGAKGAVSSPEVVAKKRASADGTPGRWESGDVIMTAIGQSETAVTPLQMAVQAATIANRGVRYQPYLVEGVYSYDLSQRVDSPMVKQRPVVASQIEIKNPVMYQYIEQGMIDAAKSTPAGQYSLNTLPGRAAIKTGTPQTGATNDIVSSAFNGYYPVEDPEIAFAGFVEYGEYSKYMVRKIIDAYYAAKAGTLGQEKETSAEIGANIPISTEPGGMVEEPPPAPATDLSSPPAEGQAPAGTTEPTIPAATQATAVTQSAAPVPEPPLETAASSGPESMPSSGQPQGSAAADGPPEPESSGE